MTTVNMTANGTEPLGCVKNADQCVWLWGDFDGGTVTVQALPDGAEAFTLFTATAKQEPPKGVGLAAGVQLQAVLSGAGASTDINILLK